MSGSKRVHNVRPGDVVYDSTIRSWDTVVSNEHWDGGMYALKTKTGGKRYIDGASSMLVM